MAPLKREVLVLNSDEESDKDEPMNRKSEPDAGPVQPDRGGCMYHTDFKDEMSSWACHVCRHRIWVREVCAKRLKYLDQKILDLQGERYMVEAEHSKHVNLTCDDGSDL